MSAYLLARLAEQSTWVGISATIAGAALVPEPYSYAAIAAGIIAILVPNKGARA